MLRFPVVPNKFVLKKLVVVACVPVAFVNVNFCNVVDPLAKMLVVEAVTMFAVVAKRFVVVALVVVEFVAVKFCNVVEPFNRRFESVVRPAVAVRVPVKFAALEIVCPLIRPEVIVPRFAFVANKVEAKKFVVVAFVEVLF